MKRSAILFALLVSWGTLLFGQDHNTTIGIKLKPGAADLSGKPVPDWFRYARLSKSGGVEFRKNLSKSFFLESGIYVSDKGYRMRYESKNRYGHVLEIMHIADCQYNLSVPLSIGHRWNNYFVVIGPNANFFFYRQFFENGKLQPSDNWGIKTFSLGAELSFGYEKPISDKILFSVEGYYSRVLPLLCAYEYINYGIGLGLKYISSKRRGVEQCKF